MFYNQVKGFASQANIEAMLSMLKAYLEYKHDEDYIPRSEIIQFCKKIELFQALSYSEKLEIKDIGLEEAVINILKHAKLEELPLGHILYEKGEDSDKFYVLLVGTVCIYKQKTAQEINLEFRNKRILDINNNNNNNNNSNNTPPMLATMTVSDINHNEIYTTPSPTPLPFHMLSNSNSNDNLRYADKILVRPKTSIVSETNNHNEMLSSLNTTTTDFASKNLKYSINRFSAGNGITKLKVLATITPINVFGAEMINNPNHYIRDNMAVALTPIKVLAIDINGYKKVIFERDLNLKKRKIFFSEYFKDLNSLIIDTISQYMEYKSLKQGKSLYSEGDQIDGLYFLEEGKIKLVKRMNPKQQTFFKDKDKNEFSAERIVDEVSRGHIFGEELLFPNIKHRRYSSIVTFNHTCVYKLDKKYYGIMCKDHENVVKKMKESCLAKIQWREKRMESMINTSREQILKLNDITRKMLSPFTVTNVEKTILGSQKANCMALKDAMSENFYNNNNNNNTNNKDSCANSKVDTLCSARVTHTPESREFISTISGLHTNDDSSPEPKKLPYDKIFFKFNPTPADLSSMPASSRSQYRTKNHSMQGHSKERKRELLLKLADNVHRRQKNISPNIFMLKKQLDNKIIFNQRKCTISPINYRTISRKEYCSTEREGNSRINERDLSMYINRQSTGNNNNNNSNQNVQLEDISQKLNDLTSYVTTELRFTNNRRAVSMKKL